ncbi:MAG: thiamine phosphate synthase [Acidobacteriota bacterium]
MNAIVDVEAAERAGWTAIDLATACVNGGVRFLQIRAKTLPSAAYFDLSSRICEMAHRAGATVIVNDRADVARLSRADGLHVGQDDLPVAAARAIMGADAIVGTSTHTEAQIEAAMKQPVTYVAVGPVFGTSTKATGYSAVGVARVRYAAERLQRRTGPRAVVAIGGITLDNAAAVIDAGATAVAVITDLLATGDPEARVRAYLARLVGRGVGRGKV